MNRGQFFRYGSVILCVLCLTRLFWWLLPGVCSIWDRQLEDQVMRFAAYWGSERQINPDIVHIDLDDQSISSLPYDKNDYRLYAELIRVLKQAGVKAVLMDMAFPYCRRGQEEYCDGFAEEAGKAGNVYLPLIMSDRGGQGGVEPQGNWTASSEQAVWNIDGTGELNLQRGEVILANYAGLDAQAAGLGHINSSPDRDGVYRRLPLIIQSGKGPVPSIALRAICGYLNVKPGQIAISGNNIILKKAAFPDGRLADIAIPVDARGQNRINFRGAWNKAFYHYSFGAVINTAATEDGLANLTDELENTFAVVSDVSTGSRDFGPTPLSSYFPLSGMHSHFANSVMENDLIREAGYGWQLAVDIVLVIVLTLVAVPLRGVRFTAAATVLFLLMLFAATDMFITNRFLIPMVRPSATFILAVPMVMLMQFFEVQKRNQYIRGRFSHYFAPSLMDKILKQPELLDSVEKKTLTILFSDIVGFSSWSAARDAQEIHRTLNKYFEAMADIVFAFQGTIDKYMGDGLMVFFGDPLPCEDHALKAVQAAIAMQKKTRELRAEWEPAGGMPIEIRVGIHTGEVVVGNMGSRSRMEYTVIGSNVNLAQRLESNCEPGAILISAQTAQCLDGSVAVEAAGTIRAKGFPEPVTVYTVSEAQG